MFIFKHDLLVVLLNVTFLFLLPLLKISSSSQYRSFFSALKLLSQYYSARHTHTTHPHNTPTWHTHTTQPHDIASQHTLMTHPHGTPAQHTHKTHLHSTPTRHTQTTHPHDTPSRHTCFVQNWQFLQNLAEIDDFSQFFQCHFLPKLIIFQIFHLA